MRSGRATSGGGSAIVDTRPLRQAIQSIRKRSNTAYIERLNATFRGALSPLTRRGRAIARGERALDAGMDLVGCAYNFCWAHDSLRIAAGDGQRRKWQERTPAMAAGLTDHCWTMREWVSRPIPLPPWAPPKRRGRPPKRSQAAMA